MKKRRCSHILKCLAVDFSMVLLLVLLIGFTLWVLWMYYLRGPIDMETRGYVSKTLKEVSVKPTDIEKYTLQHFHNLDKEVLKGIEYPSTCVSCHGDYPHNATAKVRAFLNAHSWFVACEVCHRDNDKADNIVYKWLDNDTDIELYKLQGKRGIYGARVVPFLIDNKSEQRLDNLIDKEEVDEHEAFKDKMSDKQKELAIENMHKTLSKEPVNCDQCHIEDSLFEFTELLYSEKMAKHLELIDVGTMVKGYKDFHLPDIFESND